MAAEWPHRPIGDICNGLFDGPHATPAPSETGPVFLRIENIERSGRLDFSDIRRINDADFPRWTRRVQPEEDDIVFSYEANLGLFCRIPAGFHGCLGRRLALVRPDKSKVYPQYLLYAFLSPTFQEHLRQHTVLGSTVDRLSLKEFPKYQIPVPPLAEQKAIAAVLGALDDKIELNRRMNATLEAMARALFQSWFVDFDPVRAKLDGRQPPGLDQPTADLFPAAFEHQGAILLPKGWEIGPLSRLAAADRQAIAGGPFGSSLSRQHYTESGVPVIRGSNMSGGSGWFYDRDFAFVSNEKAQSLGKNSARPGDVIFTQRGTLGQVALIPPNAAYPLYIISQSQMKMTCAEGVPSSYVYLYFVQPSTVEYILANATSSGVPHVNLGFLRDFPVLIPPRPVLATFGELVSGFITKITANDRESETLAALRDALLPKLLSGEVKVGTGARLGALQPTQHVL